MGQATCALVVSSALHTLKVASTAFPRLDVSAL
ncbi:rCG20077 [Rattus norvegicus]|uniref:RCG20077 n=1 Tax=Rattus norvegicus TaxID=10116 RepID=A6JGG9_RAT|nr:rCG20077 [Rattus norvegicus]